MLQKPPLLATLFTLAGFALLCALGGWQIQRLEWKRGILTKVAAEYEKNAKEIFLTPDDLAGDFDFLRGTVKGRYVFSTEILVGPRMHEGKAGYHVLTPLRVEDGDYLLVNRGWVPQGYNVPGGRSEAIRATGMLRKPSPRNAFTPQNEPGAGRWYYGDPQEIAAAKLKEPVYPYILYLEGDDWKDKGYSGNIKPIPHIAAFTLNNHHLQYAVFWFAMAGSLLAVFILRFCRKET